MMPDAASRDVWQLPAMCGRSSNTSTEYRPVTASSRARTAPAKPAPAMPIVVLIASIFQLSYRDLTFGAIAFDRGFERRHQAAAALGTERAVLRAQRGVAKACRGHRSHELGPVS